MTQICSMHMYNECIIVALQCYMYYTSMQFSIEYTQPYNAKCMHWIWYKKVHACVRVQTVCCLGQVSEQVLVRDLMYVLQGIDGQYIKMTGERGDSGYRLSDKVLTCVCSKNEYFSAYVVFCVCCFNFTFVSNNYCTLYMKCLPPGLE